MHLLGFISKESFASMGRDNVMTFSLGLPSVPPGVSVMFIHICAKEAFLSCLLEQFCVLLCLFFVCAFCVSVLDHKMMGSKDIVLITWLNPFILQGKKTKPKHGILSVTQAVM
jgi:hypothetical protein